MILFLVVLAQTVIMASDAAEEPRRFVNQATKGKCTSESV